MPRSLFGAQVCPCTPPQFPATQPHKDRWPSGRRRTPGKCVGGEPSRGFESLSVRQQPPSPSIILVSPGFCLAFPGVSGGFPLRRRLDLLHIPALRLRVSAAFGGRSVCLARAGIQGNIWEFSDFRAFKGVFAFESAGDFRALRTISLLDGNRECNPAYQGKKFRGTGRPLRITGRAPRALFRGRSGRHVVARPGR